MMKYLIKDIIFLLLTPLIYLTDWISRIGAKVFSKDEPELNLKNVLSLLGFIVISPLVIVVTPIQRAYIRHLQEKANAGKK